MSLFEGKVRFYAEFAEEGQTMSTRFCTGNGLFYVRMWLAVETPDHGTLGRNCLKVVSRTAGAWLCRKISIGMLFLRSSDVSGLRREGHTDAIKSAFMGREGHDFVVFSISSRMVQFSRCRTEQVRR